MAMQVNIHDAKTHFSALIEKALSGEEVIVARNGKPVIRLVPVTHKKELHWLGMDEGKVVIAEDFDAPLEMFSEYMSDREHGS